MTDRSRLTDCLRCMNESAARTIGALTVVIIVSTLCSALSLNASEPVRLNVGHLPNAIQVHEKVVSGGLPEGEDGFRSLKQLGIQTVISVDGAAPDLVMARKYGLRYIHLPHSYDGIPDQRVLELARAVRDSDGPVYIHCHHGKHRSPAAAAAACVTAGMMEPSNALSILELAGTGKNYRGLFETAATARRVDLAVIDQIPADFPESVPLPELTELMVQIEKHHDRLKAAAATGWKATDSEASREFIAEEALLLREHFTELLRSPEQNQREMTYLSLLRKSEQQSEALEKSLRQWIRDDQSAPAGKSATPEETSEAFKAVTKLCLECHQKFRDVPLSEKAVRK
jgi:protein tyrosine phosphatase (PTP) superfamily phosphohydrolase (DUF442 family)